jgi:hypothetical protein
MPSINGASIYFLQNQKLEPVEYVSGDSFPEPEDGIRWIHLSSNDMSQVAVSTPSYLVNTTPIDICISYVLLSAIQIMP